MSKTIKLEDQVYDRLEQLREKRETFSQVVGRLLRVIDKVQDLAIHVQAEHLARQQLGGEDKTDPAAVPDRSSYPLY